MPNYLYFQDDFAPVEWTWSSEVRLFNTDAIKGMQFDVHIPEGIAIETQDFELSPTWSSFQLSTSSLGDNAFRVIVFSLSGATLPPGDEALVLCQGSVDQDMVQASYDLPLTNVVLSNASNENVSTVASAGPTTVNCPRIWMETVCAMDVLRLMPAVIVTSWRSTSAVAPTSRSAIMTATAPARRLGRVVALVFRTPPRRHL